MPLRSSSSTFSQNRNRAASSCNASCSQAQSTIAASEDPKRQRRSYLGATRFVLSCDVGHAELCKGEIEPEFACPVGKPAKSINRTQSRLAFPPEEQELD